MPTLAEPRAPQVPKEGRRRTDAPTAVLHWLVALLAGLSFLTGVRVAADLPGARWSRVVAVFALQGEVILWHVASAAALMAAATGYVVFLLRARLTGRVALDARRMQALRSPSRTSRWRSINVLVYWSGFVLLLAAGITGTFLYSGLVIPSRTGVIAIHSAIAWGLAGYVVLHVSAQVLGGGWRALVAIVAPRLSRGRAAVAALTAAIAVAAVVITVDAASVRPLVIARVVDPPRLDGDPGDLAWARATAVPVQTSGGANLLSGEVTVTVRAVHDSSSVYFLFEWPDATRSQKHLPLQKTAAGWRMLQEAYDRDDENLYYEDKFAVMLARGSRLAALRAMHLGPRPLEGMPGSPAQRGLHYTTDSSIVDVWHWMSVRTAPVGQLEDSYFGPPRPLPDTPVERYAGGYALDPGTGGGSMRNWKGLLAGPLAPRFDGGVVPRFLPADPAVLARLGSVNLDPSVSDEGDWWLPIDAVRPYSAALDSMYPIGTVVPSVIMRGPLEGDRGDVSAVARWSNGGWRLEVKRKLDTDSPWDLPVADGTYLWVTVFDHTQTRHSRHLRPLRIELH